MTPLLEVRGLAVELPTPAGWVRPVNEASLRIGTGDALGLVGESGSGKTMLSLALMGLLAPGALFPPDNEPQKTDNSSPFALESTH